METIKVAKGFLKEPVKETIVCQFCDKDYSYIRKTTGKRKSCLECVPEGRGSDAALIRRALKSKMVRVSGGKCKICSLEDHPAIYDFHHLDSSEKDFSFGDKTSSVRWEVIEKELEKCVMLCSNCHRLIHAGAITLNTVTGVE